MRADAAPADQEGPLAALWTPRGRGAVATIRLLTDVRQWAGTDLLPFRAANGKPLRTQPTGRVILGKWGGDAAEDVVLSIVDERTLEIHCHGGEAAASRILSDCSRAGCRVTTWTEMVRRRSGSARSRTARSAVPSHDAADRGDPARAIERTVAGGT